MASPAKKGLLFAYVPEETARAVKKVATDQKRSISAVVRIIVEEWLRDRKGGARGQSKKGKTL